MLDFFRKLFDISDWPPRWHCGNWTDFHGWLYIISDLLIWSAYFALPLLILKFISRKTDAKFVRAYFLFAAFILACGSTHLLDAITFWYPAYRLNALVKFFTGVVSWITVFYAIRILPTAMALKTNVQLENEVMERQKAENELIKLNKQLNEAQHIGKIGYWQWEVKTNSLSWSETLYKMYGLDKNTPLTFEHFISKIHPDDRHFVQDSIEEAFKSKNFQEYVHRIARDDGEQKVMQARGEVILDEKGEVVAMIGTGQDITEQYQFQQQLLDKTKELETVNIELQKFAYIASHDLQEPLRKILTFASLLQKESGNLLSEKSKSYIDKMVNASSRMQKLIGDILSFSSLKKLEEAFQNISLMKVLDQVLIDLEVTIENNKAQIKVGQLPQAEIIPSQIGQLFQNLLSNAIKFRRDETPVIQIESKKITGYQLAEIKSFEQYAKNLAISHRRWGKEFFIMISIKDNGAGFDPAYSEKIFEIFQRLHSNKEEGTGIGLAICKKIMDNHHGAIIAQSNLGIGTEFIIALPVSQKNFLK